MNKVNEKRLQACLEHIENKKIFLDSFSKVCPKCGAIVMLSAKGCDSCLFQFNGGYKKYVKRLGKECIKS